VKENTNHGVRTDKVYRQKLDYIHWNPVHADVCKLTEEYKYSSALFYETGNDNPSASSGGISYSSPGLNYRSMAGERKHPPRRKFTPCPPHSPDQAVRHCFEIGTGRHTRN